jgi:hypothetical protein
MEERLRVGMDAQEGFDVLPKRRFIAAGLLQIGSSFGAGG